MYKGKEEKYFKLKPIFKTRCCGTRCRRVHVERRTFHGERELAEARHNSRSAQIELYIYIYIDPQTDTTLNYFARILTFK